MSRDVLATTPGTTADRVWSEMKLRGIRHFVVMDRKSVVGVISDRDLGGRSGASVRRGRTVSDLMAHDVVSAGPETTLRQAANLMRGRTIGCLPVLENGRLVGIVTITDILVQLGRGSTRPVVRAQRPTLRARSGHHKIGGVDRTRVIGPKTRGASGKRARGPGATKTAAG